jgi:hypothetical protein
LNLVVFWQENSAGGAAILAAAAFPGGFPLVRGLLSQRLPALGCTRENRLELSDPRLFGSGYAGLASGMFCENGNFKWGSS